VAGDQYRADLCGGTALGGGLREEVATLADPQPRPTGTDVLPTAPSRARVWLRRSQCRVHPTGGWSPWSRMNLEKVVFGFFVLLAATLNFGFFIGDISDPTLHNEYELFAAVVVNLVATVLKFGDRTQIGAVHLATSLVADLQLIAATLVFAYATQVSSEGLTAAATASVVSLSGGALLANVVSLVLLVVETVSFRRS
jgi:hypothetical protein